MTAIERLTAAPTGPDYIGIGADESVVRTDDLAAVLAVVEAARAVADGHDMMRSLRDALARCES